MAGPKDKYGFHHDFERMVLAFCCTSPRFWGRVGSFLDPECMELPEAKLVLETVRAIAHETGRGPAGVVIVFQRLKRRIQEGKVTPEQVTAVVELVDDELDKGLLPEDDVVAELAPVLRRRMQSEAIIQAHDLYAGRKDLDEVAERLMRAKALGQVDMTVGVKVAEEGFDAIERAKSLERLPTGVHALDLQLNEGLPRGQMGVALGDSGGGKSMFLNSQAAEALRLQLNVAYATLELPEPVVLARLYAALTGVPINQILENDADRAEAKRRMAVMKAHIGTCFVQEFAPQVTTVADIRDWVVRCEASLTSPISVVVVDYADKLFDPRTRDGNEYLAMRAVYEGLRRDIAAARRVWLWTASQASRPTKDSNKRLDLHHVADSMHKVRTVDLVVTLNVRDDGQQMLFYVAKNRTGRSRFQVGPEVTDFERGRITPVAKEFMAW